MILLIQILGGLFGIFIAYAMDYFVVVRPLKKEKLLLQQELEKIRSNYKSGANNDNKKKSSSGYNHSHGVVYRHGRLDQ